MRRQNRPTLVRSRPDRTIVVSRRHSVKATTRKGLRRGDAVAVSDVNALLLTVMLGDCKLLLVVDTVDQM